MPTCKDSLIVIANFMATGGMPGVITCIDYTHILINNSHENWSEVFTNWKESFSLNVKAAYGPHLVFYNKVARWSRNTHSSSIYALILRMSNIMDISSEMGYAYINFLLKPLFNPQTPKKAQITTWKPITRAFGTLKWRFGCLAKKTGEQIKKHTQKSL